MGQRVIPYGRQSIDNADIQAVIEVLSSDWLTQGPVIERFERAVAEYCGAHYAVAVANGTAALHLAALTAGFGPGDEVITTPNTFVASANCILYSGAKPIFADIDAETYCLDTERVRQRLGSKTKGIIPVHFAGHPADMPGLHALARDNNLVIIEDGAHAIGASYRIGEKNYRIGSCAHSDMTIFSFHPVKHITTGEGGVITTNSEPMYRRLLRLRTHGITKDAALFTENEGPRYYEMQELGFNYRITDFQCALGLSQLKKLDAFVARRREIVEEYNTAFLAEEELVIPHELPGVRSSYHLYVVQLKALDRLTVFNVLRKKGLGVNVHYIPVYRQPYYKYKYHLNPADYSNTEAYYARAITMPLFPAMSDQDVDFVIGAVRDTIRELKA